MTPWSKTVFRLTAARIPAGSPMSTANSMAQSASSTVAGNSAPNSAITGSRVTIHNLKVLRVDPENHLLILEGGIPGAPTAYVSIRKAVTAKKIKVAQVEKVKKGKK